VALTERTAALSGISRTTRQPKVTIQRMVLVFPSAISAGNLHNLPFVPIKI